MNINRERSRYGTVLAGLIVVLSACSSAAPPAPPTATTGAVSTSSAAATDVPSASASNWDAVLAEAKGQTVNWYMWGGDDLINQYVTGYLNTQAKPFGITINEVTISDTVDAVNKVLGEKSAGKDDNGSVDMIWINGENFTTMKQASALYCGWVHDLPNDQYVDWNNPTVANDFGIAVDNCEAPWTLAQFAMIYDSAKVPTPPTDAASLIAWIKANPGKFAYPAMPDFTGSVFARQMFYYVNGGYQDLLGNFDQAKYDSVAPKLWTLLNDIEPSLWRQGSTYPQNIAAVDQLYANGEVSLNMTYGPTETAGFVQKGTWPATTREFVFDSGMIGDVSYVAIPYNSPHQAAAKVVANILLSPNAQLKAMAAGSLGYPAIDVGKLPADQQTPFKNYAFPPEVAPLDVLIKNSNPELQAKWATTIEADWTKNVLQK